MSPSPTSEPHCPESDPGEPGNLRVIVFFKYVFLPRLSGLVCDGKFFPVRVRLYFGAEIVLCNSSPLSLPPQIQRDLKFMSPGLCGSIFTCGALEDGSLKVGIIL